MSEGKASFAVAYAMGKKRRRMAEGGDVKGVHRPIGDERDDPKWMRGQSETGSHVEGERGERAKAEHRRVLGEMASMRGQDRTNLAEGGEVCRACEGGECYEHGGDVVSRVMAKRYAEGGRVSNEDEPIADEESAEFDDMELDDDLSAEDEGSDERGDDDIVSRAMRARKKA